MHFPALYKPTVQVPSNQVVLFEVAEDTVPLNNLDRKEIIPSNQEIKLGETEHTLTRTDLEGNILFSNTTLANISGYTPKELFKTPQSILRHPDMPKAIFYLVWQKLLAGLSTQALIKNFTKNGDHFWIMQEFSVQRDNDYNIISYVAKGTAPTEALIEKIEPLYETLLKDEQQHGMYHSIATLGSILEKKNVASYSDYLHKLENRKKSNLFETLKWAI